MVKMERYESRIDRMEAEVESYDLGTRSLKDELSELSRDDRFEDELAELRAKLGKQTASSNTA